MFDELAASTLYIRIDYWIETSKSKAKSLHLVLKTEVSIKILEELKKQGIYLPADIIELKNYSDQAILTNEF